MASLKLQQGESVLVKAQGQLVKGFPQTNGDLYLTDRRLILVPNQLLSIGFGKDWELPLSRIDKLEKRGRFQGGPFFGSAGNRIILHLHDKTRYVLAFLGSIDQFYSALSAQIGNQPSLARSESQVASEKGPPAQSPHAPTSSSVTLSAAELDASPPQKAEGVGNCQQPDPTSAEDTSQSSDVAPYLVHSVRPLKDRNMALVLEILPGLFGLLGFGWIYSGNTTAGVIWLIGVLVWDFIALFVNVLTTGFGCCLTLPVQLVLVAVSAASLNAYTKKRPEVFGA